MAEGRVSAGPSRRPRASAVWITRPLNTAAQTNHYEMRTS